MRWLLTLPAPLIALIALAGAAQSVPPAGSGHQPRRVPEPGERSEGVHGARQLHLLRRDDRHDRHDRARAVLEHVLVRDRPGARPRGPLDRLMRIEFV